MKGMKGAALLSAVLLALVLMPASAPAQEYRDLKPSPPLFLRGEGSFFIDGYRSDTKYCRKCTFLG